MAAEDRWLLLKIVHIALVTVLKQLVLKWTWQKNPAFNPDMYTFGMLSATVVGCMASASP